MPWIPSVVLLAALGSLAISPASAEILVEHDRPGPVDSRPLHVPLVRAGVPSYETSLTSDRLFHQRARAELPEEMRALDAQPAFDAVAAAGVDSG